jgi:hypothetical protein
MHRTARILAFSFAVALLCASCGNLGLADLGDILGSRGPGDDSDVEGTVTGLDVRDQRIDVDVHEVNNLRESRPDSSIYHDADTVVRFEGRTYGPEDLEHGDVIQAAGANVGGRYVADEIDVVRNVRGP